MAPLPVVDEAGLLTSLAPAPGILGKLAENYPDDFDENDFEDVCIQNGARWWVGRCGHPASFTHVFLPFVVLQTPGTATVGLPPPALCISVCPSLLRPLFCGWRWGNKRWGQTRGRLTHTRKGGRNVERCSSGFDFGREHRNRSRRSAL